ncbi:MAG: NAD-dependent deacylase [Nitrospirota bacterium]
MSVTEEARRRLGEARSVAVLTGAGISADSGVPTFRGPEGLWRSFRPEELATPEAFLRDPNLVWEWYDWRRGKVAACRPNPAHDAIVRLESRVPRFSLLTQNVDGLHREAGSQNVIELHGNIWKVRCTNCHEVGDNRDVPIQVPPHCETCGGLLRPHIVWFGESLDPDDIRAAFEAAESCEVFLVVGTSGIVQPAASFVSTAKRAGAFVIEANLDPTPNTWIVDVHLSGRAAEVLPSLID